MRSLLALLTVAVLVLGALVAYAGPGPAPNAGDGVPDGSGLDLVPFGYGETPGPAPNAGDGVPDGSGF